MHSAICCCDTYESKRNVNCFIDRFTDALFNLVGLIDRHATTQRVLEKSIGSAAMGLPDDLRKRGVTQSYTCV